MRQLAEENSPVDCFCRRGNERKRGDRCGSTGTKSLSACQKRSCNLLGCDFFFRFVRNVRDSNKEGAMR